MTQLVPPHHIKSSSARWHNDKVLKATAQDMIEWFDANQGAFPGLHTHAFAIHHSQIDDETPLNAFVVRADMVGKPGKEDKKERRSSVNYFFPARVIFDAEVYSALPTFLQRRHVKHADDKKEAKTGVFAQSNLWRVNEGCISYPHRKAKKCDRFMWVLVKYWYFDGRGKRKEVSEWVKSLKAHIFQHEVDHARGWDIFFGDGERREIPIEDYYRERGMTKPEKDKEEQDRRDRWWKRVLSRAPFVIVEHADRYYKLVNVEGQEVPAGYILGHLDTYYTKRGDVRKEFKDAEPCPDDPYADHQRQ